jgi:hypothetical protein
LILITFGDAGVTAPEEAICLVERLEFFGNNGDPNSWFEALALEGGRNSQTPTTANHLPGSTDATGSHKVAEVQPQEHAFSEISQQ